jgi:ABC-2 type transport system ATP-binding protein
MKRRFMIARALVHKPKILVLDEPTAGVDVELRHELYDLIRELNKEGTTVILTSHYLEEVELLCDRVAIVNKGMVVALDHKKQLKDRFQSSRTLKIALTEPGIKIPDTLKKFSPEIKDSELSLTFEENDYREILQAVAKADFPLLNFTVIEPSLEDVFVSLTQE